MSSYCNFRRKKWKVQEEIITLTLWVNSFSLDSLVPGRFRSSSSHSSLWSMCWHWLEICALSVQCGGTTISTPPCTSCWPIFSFLEVWYVTSTVPSMLANFVSETKTISFSGCFLQFYFFSTGGAKTFFLSAMASDRYLAICRPLHYPTIMPVQRCIRMGAWCWVCGFSCFLLPVYLISQLPFYGPNTIDHFLCDPGSLIKLPCVPAPATEIICATFNSVIIFSTLVFITSSYTLVIRAVFRVPSAECWCKAFCTCGSHLAVVSLFYGSIMIIYVSPTAGNSAEMQKYVTLPYIVLTPLFNPLIYSLWNKEMKEALRKLIKMVRFSQRHERNLWRTVFITETMYGK